MSSNLDEDIKIVVRNTTRNIADTSASFRLYFEPEVSIGSPKLTDEYKFGDPITIKWKNRDLGSNDYFQLFYSTNDGVSYTPIVYQYYGNLVNEGDSSSYTWTAPDLSSNLDQDIKVVVKNSTRNVADTSASFRLYFESVVDIASPTDGQYVLQGSVLPITWTNGDLGTNDYFNIRYSTNGGASFTTIANPYYSGLTNSENQSTYNWTTPLIDNSSIKVLVINSTRNVRDTTLSFSICSTCPTVALYTPNGGETLAAGAETTIGWNLGADWTSTDAVTIEFSDDNGATYSSIFDGTYASVSENSYSWIVPTVVTSQGLIRITNTTLGISDVSDATFSVAVPAIAPSDFYIIENSNNTATLYWTDNDTSETNYRVQYSSNNTTWSTYTNSLAANSTQYTPSINSNVGYWWRVVAVNANFTAPSESRYGTNYFAPGRALNFDGTDDKITLDSVEAFNFGTGAYTIETWFNVSDLSSSRVLLSDYNNTTSGSQGIYLTTSGTIAAFIGSNTPDLTTSASVSTDVWNHMALVRAGDSAVIYLNGIEAAKATGLGSRELSSTQPLTIGQQPAGSSFPFVGSMDEVRIWSDARSLAELNEYMLSTAPENSTDLLAYYKFDHQSGNFLADVARHNIQGSWSGSTGSNTQANWVISGALTDNTPTVSLTYPNGGQSFTENQQINITWTSTNFSSTDNLTIGLSTEEGGDFVTIHEGTSGELGNSYTWVIPDSTTTTALIKISNTTKGVEDVSDSYFSMTELIPSVIVTTPNGGQDYTVGQQVTITWSAANFDETDNLVIGLSTTEGGDFATLVEGTHSELAGSYTWTVPDSVTTTALIKVENTTQTVSDVSNSFFTISEAIPTVTLAAPNGGETYTVGDEVSISWTSTNFVATDAITLSLSTTEGGEFATIVEGTHTEFGGSYTWTVPDSVTTTALIKVENTTQEISDISDAYFTIAEVTPTIVVNTPNGGESYSVGDQVTIEWTQVNFDDTDDIIISLSTSEGGDFVTINQTTSNVLGGSFSWTIPDSVTTTALIKVENVTKSISDVSDAYFTINELVEPSVTVLSPNGSEVLSTLSDFTISWEMVGAEDTDQIAISLSMDGGETFGFLSQGILGTTYPSNSFTWEVGDSVSTSALIEVENVTKNVRDTSDAVFAIENVVRNLSITSPTGGEQFIQGESYTISFESEGLLPTDELSFALSVDGGLTYPYTLIQASFSVFSDNSFTWTVNQPVSSEAHLKASVAAYGIADTTDVEFTIIEPTDAPIFICKSASIVGDEMSLQYSMDDAGSVYVVVLEDQRTKPTADQVKAAAIGGEPLAGQMTSGSYTYATANTESTELLSAAFIRGSVYDVYLTSEDALGNLNPGVSIPNVKSQYTLLEQDSIIVSNVYVTMGGDDWENTAEDWNNLTLEQREEITVENGRITGVNFSDKGMSGDFTDEILGLDAMSDLVLSGNKLSSVPDVTALVSLTLFDVSNNSLDFADLEPLVSLFSESDQYSPQGLLGEADSVAIIRGTSYTFEYDIAGSTNSYSWKVDYYKTYEEDFTTLEGATSPTLTISSLQYDSMGTYQVEIENELLPGLTLATAPVRLWGMTILELTVFGKNDELLSEGAAYALRNRGPGIPFDSIPKLENGQINPDGFKFTNGKLVFDNLILGDYLIAVRADPDVYLPTYYSSTYLWEEADTILFRGDFKDTMKMASIPAPLTPDDGSGLLSGTVESDFGENGRIDARRKVKRAGCSVRRFVPKGRTSQEDGEFELIAYVESDDEGRFTIEFLPAGLYRFNIEYPGIPMDKDSYVEFEIGEEGTTNNKIELQATVTEDGIVVERINLLSTRTSLVDVNVYPNPVSDYVTISLKSDLTGHSVSIINAAGDKLYNAEYDGKDLIWNAQNVASGIYYLRVIDEKNHNRLITKKIIVQN